MGDPACWLQGTCPTCSRVLEPDDVEAERCTRCGTPLTDDDGSDQL